MKSISMGFPSIKSICIDSPSIIVDGIEICPKKSQCSFLLHYVNSWHYPNVFVNIKSPKIKIFCLKPMTYAGYFFPNMQAKM